MLEDDPTYREASPIDAHGHVPVHGADGWRYAPFEHDDALGEIALLVIRARERWRELKGLGG